MTRTLLPAIALLCGLGSVASAQVKPAQVAGGYALLDATGKKVGSVMIALDGDGALLRTKLADGTTRPDLVFDPARSTKTRAVFKAATPPAAAVGISDVIVGGPAPAASSTSERMLELSPDLRATLKDGATVVARERLQRVRTALLVHASTYNETHVSAFHGYATRVGARYKAAGYALAETMLGTSVDAVCERLLRAAQDAQPFDRLIFIGHGGWDGPTLGKYSESGTHQSSSHYNAEVFARLVDAIRKGTTASAKIFSSSCHAGGSNVFERAMPSSKAYVWVDDVAHQTGRTAAGPAGYTSTDFTEQHVFAALEGQGTTLQEVRWASPKGVRSIRPGGTLEGTALQPVAPIAMPRPPVVLAPVAIVADPPSVDLPLGTPN